MLDASLAARSERALQILNQQDKVHPKADVVLVQHSATDLSHPRFDKIISVTACQLRTLADIAEKIAELP